MDSTSEWWAEECQRERDLNLNVLMDDGKWMFPVNIRNTIKQIGKSIYDEDETIKDKIHGTNDGNE